MNRSWIGIALILIGFVSIAVIDSSCTKKDDAKPVHFDPLATESGNKTGDKTASDSPAKATPSKKPKILIRKAPTEFIVQVGSFAQKENAEKLLNKLKDRNYKVSMVEKEHKKHGKLYLVRLEPTADLEVARTQIEKLKAQENLDPVIVAK